MNFRDDEKILMDGSANKLQIFGSKGGKLYLTNQRIIFKAHAFNIGSKLDEYELTDIENNNNTFNIKTTSNIVSFTISFNTKKGENLGFVVTRKQKDMWIKNITSALSEYVQSTVTFPENTPVEIKNNTISKIKVEQCESCAAFVTVMLNSVANCEYCNRPIAWYEN